jgi:DNA-binding transcriptional regulator LsrR (DeoR family)
VENWSDEAKQEMETEVDEVIKMALATKLKLQRAFLNQFLDTLEKEESVAVSTLENTIKCMETILRNANKITYCF